MFEEGIVYKGDVKRIKKVMDRASQGEKLTIGFIGGSITQGSVATEPSRCYAYRVYQWFVDNIPQAEFTYVNAGIGGTTSHFGVARCEEDLLGYDPDFVITEFSVNDDNSLFYRETYEGLLRRIYLHKNKPAVLVLHNVFYDTGTNAEDQHRVLGQYYHIPCLSMKTSIYQSVASGAIPVRDITPDDLHPNDKGHELLARLVTYFLDRVQTGIIKPLENNDGGDCDSCKHPCRPIMPNAMTVNAYEKAYRLRAGSESAISGFLHDTAPQCHITDTFKKGFIGRENGDYVEFKVTATEIAVQYRKSMKHPACVARVTIDNESRYILDGNFNETWGDKTEIALCMVHGEKKEHTVRVEIVDGGLDKTPFYLVSLIIA